jgi:hypothetical protein
MNPEARLQFLLEAALAEEALWSLTRGEQLLRYRLQDGLLALPLWPAQEAAALESPGPEEQPLRLGLEELLEQVLPELQKQGGMVAAFPLKGDARIVEPAWLAQRLRQDWEEDD